MWKDLFKMDIRMKFLFPCCFFYWISVLSITRLWVDVSIVLVFVTGSSCRCCSSISSFHVICLLAVTFLSSLAEMSFPVTGHCACWPFFGFSHTYYKQSISVSGLKSHCFGIFQILASRHIVQQRRLFYHLQQVPGKFLIFFWCNNSLWCYSFLVLIIYGEKFVCFNHF